MSTSLNNVQGANVKTDATDTALSVGGGYRFTRHLSVNASYRDLGKVRIYRDTGSNPFSASIKLSAMTFGGTATYPLTERLAINGHAGIYRGTFDADAPQGSGQFNERRTKGYVGLGASYAVSDRTSLGVNWIRFKAPKVVNIDDPEVLEIGVQYRF
jgi:hypothetical protein